MPIWLRKLTVFKLNEHFEKLNEKSSNTQSIKPPKVKPSNSYTARIKK